MSDAWSDIQALKQRQTSLREKLKQRKQLVLGIQSDLDLSSAGSGTGLTDIPSDGSSEARQVLRHAESAVQQKRDIASTLSLDLKEGVETHLLKALCDVGISLPIDSVQLASIASKAMCSDVTKDTVENLLKKFAAQGVISLKEQSNDMTMDQLVVTTAEHSKLEAMVDTDSKPKEPDIEEPAEKRIKKDCEANVVNSKESVTEKSEKVSGKGKDAPEDILESLLSMRSAMEKETRKMGDEILDLLSKPTAKEKSLQEQFRSAGGAQVQEFCQHGTKQECMKENKTSKPCNKLHFCKIIHKHTDESLGDCSFLNTCFHMDSCKYVHYEVDYSGQNAERQDKRIVPTSALSKQLFGDAQLTPPQWIQCDVRCLDMSVLGKFSVVMADPPWDIHMELPYGTMSDDEMRHMDVQSLQDEGFIFLWVTGRAMELGRECLQLWGYDRCDEIIWVKTNQLQRIIRTGRTGHWINHGKEHCLVGIKGNPAGANRGLDCDVIVAEVRATSHKPDEIYGIIERLSPGTRKIELFGRMHNVQPNWITLGNQLDGTHIIDPEVADSFYKMYPEGIAMTRTQPH